MLTCGEGRCSAGGVHPRKRSKRQIVVVASQPALSLFVQYFRRPLAPREIASTALAEKLDKLVESMPTQ